MIDANVQREYLKSLTLLYVEDDEEVHKQFCPFLRRLVGTLVTAINGTDGLIAYRQHHPDIIITDIWMPLMDGLSLAGEIRNTDKDVPIIVLSAFEDAAYLKKSINLGITDYITKPVSAMHFQKTLLEQANRLKVQRDSQMAQQSLYDNQEQVIAALKADKQDGGKNSCFSCPYKPS